MTPSAYVPPEGILDDLASFRHMQQIQKSWTDPVWVSRSARLQQLVEWCLRRTRAESVARQDSHYELEDALGRALSFASNFHEALNPEGARMAREVPMPDRDTEGGNTRGRWIRIVGTVWNHSDPAPNFAKWKAALERKETHQFPAACNPEAVVDILDAYVKLPHLHHPWLEWCMFDALIRTEAVGLAEHAALIEIDILNPARVRRGGALSNLLFAASDGRRAANVLAEAAPVRVIVAAILDCYSGLGGSGWTISPTRVRETMTAVERLGGRFLPAAYVLIDRAVARDPGTWHFEPP